MTLADELTDQFAATKYYTFFFIRKFLVVVRLEFLKKITKIRLKFS